MDIWLKYMENLFENSHGWIMEDWCGNKQWQISEKWWKGFKHTVMVCMMRKGGLVQNIQNGSNQNKVRWIILKLWTVKYTDVFEWWAQLYTLTILCTDRLCRTHTICHE
jgi:hypothetical protein